MGDKLYLENIEEYVYDLDKIVSNLKSFPRWLIFPPPSTTGDVQMAIDDVISIV